MPSPLPLEKQLEKRIRDLLTNGYEELDVEQKFKAITMGVAWIKATKKGGEEAFGNFFTQDDNDDNEEM